METLIILGIVAIIAAGFTVYEICSDRKKGWLVKLIIYALVFLATGYGCINEIIERIASAQKEKEQDEKISSLEYSVTSLTTIINGLVANPEDTTQARIIAEHVQDSAQTIFDSAIVAIGLGEYDNALTYLESALIASGNDSLAAVEIFFYKGITQYLSQEPLLALEFYDSSIVYNNDNHRIWNNRGVVLDELGLYEDAISSYDSAVYYKNDDHEAWYNRGIALAGLGLSVEAIASYDSAIVHKHDKHKAWCNRGIVLAKLNRNLEAIASYDSAIKYKHNDYEAWYNRGNALGKLGRYLESIASFDSTLAYRHDNYESWYNRAVSFVKLGKYKDALASCDSAIKYAPVDSSYLDVRQLILDAVNQISTDD